MKTQRKTVTENGVTYNYEALVYQGNDLPQIKDDWTDGERKTWLLAVLRKQAVEEKRVRIQRTYEGTQDDDDTDHAMIERMTMARLLLKELISLADYDMDLEIVGPKMIDSMFTRGAEKLLDNTTEAYRSTQAEKRANDRLFGGTEFDFVADERITRRLRGLEKQGRFFRALFETCLDLRPEVIANSGITTWSAYNTLKQMASQRNGKVRLVEAKKAADEVLKKLKGKTPDEYRRWLAEQGSYKPNAPGIDADDAAGAGHNQIAYLIDRRKQEEERDRADARRAEEESRAELVKLTEERMLKRLQRQGRLLPPPDLTITENGVDVTANYTEIRVTN